MAIIRKWLRWIGKRFLCWRYGICPKHMILMEWTRVADNWGMEGLTRDKLVCKACEAEKAGTSFQDERAKMLEMLKQVDNR